MKWKCCDFYQNCTYTLSHSNPGPGISQMIGDLQYVYKNEKSWKISAILGPILKGWSRGFQPWARVRTTWRACENRGFRPPAGNIKVLQVAYLFDALLDPVSRKSSGPSAPTASASVGSTNNNSLHLVESADAEPRNMEGWLYYAIYRRDLSIHGFWYPQRSWNKFPSDTEGWLWVYGTHYIKNKQIKNKEKNVSKGEWIWGRGVGWN